MFKQGEVLRATHIYLMAAMNQILPAYDGLVHSFPSVGERRLHHPFVDTRGFGGVEY
jgi:hypothetical protein